MVAIVKDNIDEIIKICERMQIQSLYLFGSASNEKSLQKIVTLIFYINLKKMKTD